MQQIYCPKQDYLDPEFLKKEKPDNVAEQSRQIRKESQLRHSTFRPSASSSAWKPTRTGLLDPLVLGVAERKGEDSLRRQSPH